MLSCILEPVPITVVRTGCDVELSYILIYFVGLAVFIACRLSSGL